MEKKSNDKVLKISYEDQEIKKEMPSQLNTIWGLFRTVTAVPTGKPVKISDQVVIYTNGATLRLYWFDSTNSVWHYVTATA